MISLKVIQTSFNPTKNPQITMLDFRSSRRHLLLSFCKSRPEDDESNTEDSPSPPPKGDPRKQDLLARIAMLQTEKVRLTDYLDERSAYLTQFAQDANAEFDAVGQNALKDLDEASARILENIETRMQEFEESAELSKQEIAKRDKELADFEDEIEKARNEGLFFKSLRQRAPPAQKEKEKAKEEANKINDLTKKISGSKIRRNIYLAFIALVGIGLADSISSSSSQDWRKVVLLAVILVGLVSQLVYEQKILSEDKKQVPEAMDIEEE